MMNRSRTTMYRHCGVLHKLVAGRAPMQQRAIVQTLLRSSCTLPLDPQTIVHREWGIMGLGKHDPRTICVFVFVHAHAHQHALTDPYMMRAIVEDFLTGDDTDLPNCTPYADLRDIYLHSIGRDADHTYYHSHLYLVSRRRGQGKSQPLTVFDLTRRCDPRSRPPSTAECVMTI